MYVYILILKNSTESIYIPLSEEYSTSETIDSFEEEKEQLTAHI